jgi:cysteine synthase
MTTIKPTGGWNARLNGYDTPENQWLLMQNMDMTHQEIFEQIKGSVKYSGASIGTAAPSAIIVNYNEEAAKQDVLIVVDDEIQKKNYGSNEFETLLSGVTPNVIKQSVNLLDKSYIASPKDGLF